VSTREITGEIEALERELGTLRDQAQEQSSAFQALADQVSELQKTVNRTHDAVADCETRLQQKQAELADVQRVYDEAVRAREESAARLAEASSRVLAELEAFEQASQSLRRLTAELGGGTHNAATADAEPETLREPWDKLVEAVRQRINERFEDELVEAAARSSMGQAIDQLPEHLREAARARRQARIRGSF
jgi:archaellum component FlaC